MNQQLLVALIAAGAGIAGAVLGILGSGWVQWKLQAEQLQHQERQLEKTLGHQTRQLYVQAAWEAKLDALEKLYQAGTLLYLTAWEASASGGERAESKKKLLESLYDEYTTVLGNAAIYLPDVTENQSLLDLQARASSIYLDRRSRPENEHKRERDLLLESWRSFDKEVKRHLPKEVLSPLRFEKATIEQLDPHS